MKNISLLLILLLSPLLSYAQTIECEKIEFSLNSEDIGLNVKAILCTHDLNKDTISLRTNVKIPQLGPKNLKANLIDNENKAALSCWIENLTDSNSFENVQLLNIIIPNKKKTKFSIEYNVFGTSLLKYQPDNIDFYACSQQYEYFYPMNVSIKKIKVLSSDSIRHFVSYKMRDNSVISDINLSFINRNHYIVQPIKGKKFNINIYTPDTLINDKRVLQNKRDLKESMNKFSSYLSKKKTTDIILINWRDDKNRRAFGEAMGNYTVCDINFQSKDLLHELIHTFFTIEVAQLSKGEYFIKESIIEWLSLFLSSKTIITKPISKDSMSIYDVEINNHTTWDLIYQKGPSIVQQVANKCGEEKMAKTIISFLELNKNKVTNYDEFIYYVKKHLTNTLGDELDFLVKDSNN